MEIPLRIYGSREEAARFRIRKLPQDGSLSAPKMTSRDEAVVTYKSSGRDSIDHDSFTYAAATSAGVSAAATIDIAITDDPPIFAVPGTVDFGEVIIGSSARREIRIENRGSGTLSGTLETDKPWSHEAGEYRLSGGARRDMWVEFAPDKEGKFTGQARFPGQPERFTDLQGTGKAPFSVSPRNSNSPWMRPHA